jgi:hypothetical protein
LSIHENSVGLSSTTNPKPKGKSSHCLLRQTYFQHVFEFDHITISNKFDHVFQFAHFVGLGMPYTALYYIEIFMYPVYLKKNTESINIG